jgi:hypothetical protein
MAIEELPSDRALEATGPSFLRRDWGVVFWVVVGLAFAFVAYLLIDWYLGRRRQKELQERWKRAASRPDSINSSE